MTTSSAELGLGVSGTMHEARPAVTHPVIEQMDLPAGGLRHDDITKAFDTLRRRVSRTSCGREGAFAGFDRLELAPDSDEDRDGRVVLTAVLVSATPGAQVVAYEAARIRENSPDSGQRRLIAQGVGRTVGLATSHLG
jgi:hypothetical protein